MSSVNTSFDSNVFTSEQEHESEAYKSEPFEDEDYESEDCAEEDHESPEEDGEWQLLRQVVAANLRVNVVCTDIPLIPVGVESPSEIVEHFETVFEQRYGERRPDFFRGSLKEASKSAFRMQKRPLVLYLHKEENYLTHKFPQRVLTDSSTVDVLKEHFVLWAWDMSTNGNIAALGQQMADASMRRIYAKIEEMDPERFPMLLTISAPRSVPQIDDIIDRTVKVFCVREVLQNRVQKHTEATPREKENTERSCLMDEQQKAYEESLAADRARVEAQREAERMRLEKEAEEQRQKEEEERIEREKQAEAERKKAMLPEEPSACDSDVIAFRVRMPGGEMESRRFHMTEKVEMLLLFVESSGFTLEEHDVFNSERPRRKVAELNIDASFADLKWPKRETIIVEEKY